MLITEDIDSPIAAAPAHRPESGRSLRCDGGCDAPANGQCAACGHHLCHDCLERHRLRPGECNGRSVVDDGGCRE